MGQFQVKPPAPNQNGRTTASHSTNQSHLKEPILKGVRGNMMLHFLSSAPIWDKGFLNEGDKMQFLTTLNEKLQKKGSVIINIVGEDGIYQLREITSSMDGSQNIRMELRLYQGQLTGGTNTEYPGTFDSLWASTFSKLSGSIDYQSNLDKLIEEGEQGDVRTQFRLGMLYKNGSGIDCKPADQNKRANYWLVKAAKNDYPDAQFPCYVMFKNGLGCQRDASIAEAYLENAVKAVGDPFGVFYSTLEKMMRLVNRLQEHFPSSTLSFDRQELLRQQIDPVLIDDLEGVYSTMQELDLDLGVPSAEFVVNFIAWKDPGFKKPGEQGQRDETKNSIHSNMLDLATRKKNALAQFVCGKALGGKEGASFLEASAAQHFPPAVSAIAAQKIGPLIAPANRFIRLQPTAPNQGQTLLSRVPKDLGPLIVAYNTANSVAGIPPAPTWFAEMYRLVHADNHGFAPG